MSQPATAPRRENLALLYQGLFTGIVRIQSGRQQIQNAEMFRRRMKEALAEVTREAMKRNYAAEHSMESDFAVVAFLDEVILSSHDPQRNEWAQKPLQEELFGVSVAGEVFFARLDKLFQRADTAELSDILEVYYLCILLGFEGKYAVGEKSELHVLSDRLRQRIERIRGRSALFSPAGLLPEETIAVAPPDPLVTKLRTAAMAAGGSAVVLFLLFAVLLLLKSSQAHEMLMKALFL